MFEEFQLSADNTSHAGYAAHQQITPHMLDMQSTIGAEKELTSED
jgi:hypothetical protein